MKKMTVLTAVLWLLISSIVVAMDAQQSPDPRQLIQERLSPLGSVEETVAAIKSNIESTEGWVINSIQPMNKKIQKLGGPAILPVTLINACNPHHAGAILQNDEERYASVMMPCTISVYEKQDGKIYIGTMNARMVGQLFGGAVQKIMGGPVADDQDKFLNLEK
jgi:uncharacterized protein (DUF302 family)